MNLIQNRADRGKITFISDLFGGEIFASSTLISPAGILFKHCLKKNNNNNPILLTRFCYGLSSYHKLMAEKKIASNSIARIHAFIHSFIPFVRSFVHSFIPFVCSVSQSVSQSFSQSFIQSVSQSFNISNLFNNAQALTHFFHSD